MIRDRCSVMVSVASLLISASVLAGCGVPHPTSPPGKPSAAPSTESALDEVVVAYVSPDGLWTATTAGKKAKIASLNPEYQGTDISGPNWLAGGRYLAWSTGRKVHVHTMADGRRQTWNCSCSGLAIFNDKIASVSLDGSVIYLFTPGTQRPELLKLHGDRVPAHGASMLAASRNRAIVVGSDPHERNELSSGPRVYVVDLDGSTRYTGRLESAFEVFNPGLTHLVDDHAILATLLITDGGIRADGILDVDLTRCTLRRIGPPAELGDFYVVGLGRTSGNVPVASIVPAVHSDDDTRRPPMPATAYAIKGTGISAMGAHWLNQWTIDADTEFLLDGEVTYTLNHHPTGQLTGRLLLRTRSGDTVIADDVAVFVPRTAQ